MKKIFKPIEPFRVPDGTLVSPFLNSKDNMSGLPFDLLDGFSVAAGTIEPYSRSKVHVMPHVTQVTFVRRGRLKICMKGPADPDVYPLTVGPDEAVLTEPGTFFQLVNDGSEPCDVLYIVSPAYLFEKTDNGVMYDDAVVVEEDWDKLKSVKWQPAARAPTMKQRRAAAARLSSRQVQR